MCASACLRLSPGVHKLTIAREMGWQQAETEAELDKLCQQGRVYETTLGYWKSCE